MSRYERQIPIVGEDGQMKLMSARVGIAGCGGLGVNALTCLVEAGVADFVLCDPDVPDISNLNRQFIYYAGDMRPKSMIAAEWVVALNCSAMVEARAEPVTYESAAMFTGCTVVLDCLDNIESRLALGDWCAENGVTLVHAGVVANNGQVTVCVPGETPCLRCMIGTMKDTPTPPNMGSTVAVVASMEATEAIRVIVGLPSKARGRLITIDMQDWTIESTEIASDPTCRRCGHQ